MKEENQHLKKENRLLVEDNNLLKDKNIQNYLKYMEKQLNGLFAFGKQVDTQKKVG